ncbi:hypothetical protein CMO83_02465 [Candidatus Woesearchaeota archaeon]|jgi:hypothetical protein|nr:hypothetical protein [Candidatus Woesearchaeota archaeon]MDP6648277.1 hypothetical protein [Candidatus Woesearchaeota archaeon]|tara:strand:- start:32029 stop:32382 length:354 start_codon:yes stop_codon:yes gene_type:complete
MADSLTYLELRLGRKDALMEGLKVVKRVDVGDPVEVIVAKEFDEHRQPKDHTLDTLDRYSGHIHSITPEKLILSNKNPLIRSEDGAPNIEETQTEIPIDSVYEVNRVYRDMPISKNE